MLYAVTEHIGLAVTLWEPSGSTRIRLRVHRLS